MENLCIYRLTYFYILLVGLVLMMKELELSKVEQFYSDF